VATKRNAYKELLELPLDFTPRAPARPRARIRLADELQAFREFGQPTRVLTTHAKTASGPPVHVETFVNEFWTARQRQANRLHEISYRACFKPQLPRFFIERLTQPGDRVYDPFMGRARHRLRPRCWGGYRSAAM